MLGGGVNFWGKGAFAGTNALGEMIDMRRSKDSSSITFTPEDAGYAVSDGALAFGAGDMKAGTRLFWVAEKAAKGVHGLHFELVADAARPSKLRKPTVKTG